MTAVTATFTDAASTPAVGWVTFQPRGIRQTFRTPSGIVTPTKVTVPLDGYGSLLCDLEPGTYNVAIVLQYSRNIYGSISVPDSDLSIDLRDLLSAYMPQTASAGVQFGVPGTFEWETPYWVIAIDYVISGAGGRGGDANSLLTGQGAWHGAWLTGTLVRGVDFKSNMALLSGVVGAGGHTEVSGVGANGEPTTITYTNVAGDEVTLTAAGGAGGGKGSVHNPSNPNPHSAGAGQTDVTFRDVPYLGGPDAMYGAEGSAPGGGGGGGAGLFGGPGGPGGPGVAFLTARRAS